MEPHHSDSLILKKHAFCSAKAYAFITQLTGFVDIFRSFCIGPYFQALILFYPLKNFLKILIGLCLDFLHFSQQHLSARTIKRNNLPFAHNYFVCYPIKFCLLLCLQKTAKLIFSFLPHWIHMVIFPEVSINLQVFLQHLV